ncbi:hypothetical protein MTO96_011026 [Rhipicephalus appendiculatus]
MPLSRGVDDDPKRELNKERESPFASQLQRLQSVSGCVLEGEGPCVPDAPLQYYYSSSLWSKKQTTPPKVKSRWRLQRGLAGQRIIEEEGLDSAAAGVGRRIRRPTMRGGGGCPNEIRAIGAGRTSPVVPTDWLSRVMPLVSGKERFETRLCSSLRGLSWGKTTTMRRRVPRRGDVTPGGISARGAASRLFSLHGVRAFCRICVESRGRRWK